MALEITKVFVVAAPPSRVWEFLIDIHRVAKCLPGAAIGEKLDDKTYAGTITVKVGPISSSYKGKVVFERLDPATRTAEVVATGQDTKGRGSADLRMTSTLRELSPGQTEVTAASKVNITGILAQMGRGMIQDVSDQMFQIFSQRMRAELEGANAPAAVLAAPASTPAAAPPPAARLEGLDLGAIGAKAAARTLLRPLPIAAVAGIVVVLWWLFR